MMFCAYIIYHPAALGKRFSMKIHGTLWRFNP